jgi:hypothetical protein
VSLETQFLTALCPEPIRLLGQKLEPYSVGHECLLRQHDNSFVTGKDNGEIRLCADLFMGVFFCCQRWDEIRAALRRDDLGKIILKWQRKFGVGAKRQAPGARRWLPRSAPFDLYSTAITFAEYIHAAKVLPEWRPTKRYGQKVTPGSPRVAMLLNHLLCHQHCSLAEALDMPWGLANWLWISWGEGEGSVRVKSQDEMDEETAVLAMMKELGLKPMRFQGD